MRLRSDLDAILDSPRPLDQIDDWLWGSLEAGALSKRHVWNAGIYSSVEVEPSGRVSPRARTVIIRQVDHDQRSIDFYTDVRTAKVHQLQSENGSAEVCWLFYRPSTKIQVRLLGGASLVGVEEAEEIWQATPLRSRTVYASIEPPGLVRPSSQPPDTSDREVTEMESERGRENFRVIRTVIRGADVLYLRTEGHVRARLDYKGDGTHSAMWLVP